MGGRACRHPTLGKSGGARGPLRGQATPLVFLLLFTYVTIRLLKKDSNAQCPPPRGPVGTVTTFPAREARSEGSCLLT